MSVPAGINPAARVMRANKKRGPKLCFGAASVVLRPNCRKPGSVRRFASCVLRGRQLKLIALAIWAIRGCALAGLVAGQNLLPLGRINLARLLKNHQRTRFVDDGNVREFLGLEDLG